MAMNLNRKRGPKKKVIPLGSLSRIKETKVGKKTTESGAKQQIASVVATICESSSYDELFRRLPQDSEYGKISVYLISPGFILSLLVEVLSKDSVNFSNLKDGSGSPISPNLRNGLKQLRTEVKECGADAVCFNFECCGGFSEAGFTKSDDKVYKDLYMNFISFLVTDLGCLCMFSDFSLKALIKDWNEKLLGPNPFVNLGVFGGDLELSFDPEKLKKSPSAQLVTIGNLSENGIAKLHAMSGTILFSITEEARQIEIESSQMKGTQEDVHPLKRRYVEPFEVEILTVSSLISNQRFTENKLSEENIVTMTENDRKGLGGHVLLTFPPSDRNLEKFELDLREEKEAKERAEKEGTVKKDLNLQDNDAAADDLEEISPVRGMILASCGHWIELMKLDVNLERLLKVVRTEWGEKDEKFRNLTSKYASMSTESAAFKAESTNLDAVGYLQSRAPAKFNRKNRRFKKKGY